MGNFYVNIEKCKNLQHAILYNRAILFYVFMFGQIIGNNAC